MSDTQINTAETQTSEEQPPIEEEERGAGLPGFLIVTGLFGLTVSLVFAGWLFGMSDGHRHRTTTSHATAVASAGHGNAQHGKELFSMVCIACHGPTGSGIPNLGANLRQSKFVAGRSDEDLVAFIKKGRQPGEPGSVLNLTMPPKGGNPAFNDPDLRDIVAFIRTLQAEENHQSLAGLQ